MNGFEIKVVTYTDNTSIYSPILKIGSDRFFIFSNGNKYPIPCNAPAYHSEIKRYGFRTNLEAEKVIESYMYKNNIYMSEDSYDYNPNKKNSACGYNHSNVNDNKFNLVKNALYEIQSTVSNLIKQLENYN
jgi:hypothetical protein